MSDTSSVQLLKSIGYSDKAILLLFLQQNFGKIENPDIIARYQSDCGDLLIIYLKLENEKIISAKFEFVGCIGLQAAASALTELIKGLSLADASKISFDDILDFLESVPESKYECIHLALNTLENGLKPYL